MGIASLFVIHFGVLLDLSLGMCCFGFEVMGMSLFMLIQVLISISWCVYCINMGHSGC